LHFKSTSYPNLQIQSGNLSLRRGASWLPPSDMRIHLVTTRSFNCFSHRMIFVWTCLPGYESTAPVADIMGPREQRVPSGSTITLRCVILSPYQTRPIRGVQWLRDNKLLTFQVMQPQLDMRDRSNEISVWRPGIGRMGEKKGRSYIIMPDARGYGSYGP